MRARFLPVAIAGLLAAGAADGLDFGCPRGTKDSGFAPHQLVRWCTLDEGGRLLFHGPLFRWHRNGKLASKETFFRGEPDGEISTWWESGRLRSLGSYEMGERVGAWTFWDEEGRVASVVTYTELGEAREDFFPSGATRASGTLRDDAKVGWWYLFHLDGEERARCDFGDGLLELPEDPDCRVIAEEVEPRGFAPPVARGAVAADGSVTVSVGPHVYAFTTPEGWVADATAGAREGFALVFAPAGSAWRKSGRDLHVRAVAKRGRFLQDVIDAERARAGRRVEDYEEFVLPPRAGRLGRIEAWTVSYTWVQRRDSPVDPGATKQMREAVAYIDASPEVALVVTLVCDHRMKMKDALPAFLALIESPRAVSPALVRK